MKEIKFTNLARRQLRNYNLLNKNIKLIAITDRKTETIMYLGGNTNEAELVLSFAEEVVQGSKLQSKIKELEFIEVSVLGLKKLLRA